MTSQAKSDLILLSFLLAFYQSVMDNNNNKATSEVAVTKKQTPKEANSNSLKLPKHLFHDGVTYELVKVLGRGGYAVALSARRIVSGGGEERASDSSESLVAIKSISLGSFSGKKAAQVVQLAKREVSIMKSLDHPNIVKLYTHWAEDNFIFIVMQLCVNRVSGTTCKHSKL